jgi:hypothetical protein
MLHGHHIRAINCSNFNWSCPFCPQKPNNWSNLFSCPHTQYSIHTHTHTHICMHKPTHTRKRPQMSDRRVLLLHDNARPHTAHATVNLLKWWGWEILQHCTLQPGSGTFRLSSLPQPEKTSLLQAFLFGGGIAWAGRLIPKQNTGETNPLFQLTFIPHLDPTSRTTTSVQCTQLAAKLYLTPGSNTSAGHQCSSHYTVLLVMGILVPETCWVKIH